MRIKAIIVSLLAAGCFTQAHAQQQFEISQYMQNNFIYNPAAAGAADQSSVGAIYRKMWSGIEGGPQTVVLYGDTYFDKKKTGVSIYVYDDKTGPTSRTGGQVNLSYSVELGSKEKRLMFGLGGMVFQYQLDKAYIADDIPNDPLLSASSSKLKADAAAGVYLKTPTINIGASIEQLIKPKLNFLDNSSGKLYRHYYIMADYNWKVDEDNTLVPNALLKYLYNSPIDLQVGMKLQHKDLLWIGFGYHYKQNYSAYAGLKIAHQLEIGYAYDQFQTPLNVFDDGGGGNEISLRYYFKK